jgi:hypothetical protein
MAVFSVSRPDYSIVHEQNINRFDIVVDIQIL